MKFFETPLKGAFIIELEPRRDERGFFARTFCAKEFAEKGLRQNMVQSNLSRSVKRHTLRGMHYQKNGFEEAKLVRCIAGSILDVIIDLRPDSSSYCRYFAIELRNDSSKMLYVPEGFAHGFITLENNSDVFYQVSNFYSQSDEAGIRWNDPAIGIQWPVADPVISEKDRNFPDFIPVKK